MSAVALVNSKRASKQVCIGSRWKPGHVERWDSEAGNYECVNSKLLTSTELNVQRALLAKPSESLLERLFG